MWKKVGNVFAVVAVVAWFAPTARAQERRKRDARLQVPKGVRAVLDVAYVAGPDIHPRKNWTCSSPTTPSAPRTAPCR